MGYLSRLDAVNMMMLAAGESLVADLEEASGIDTGIAEFILDQSSLEYQLKGQVENRIRRTAEPDANGRILLSFPSDDYLGVISASLVSNHWNDDDIPIQARVEEGTPPKLFNMTDSTDVWNTTEEYVIDIVMFLRWEQLDTASQRAVLGDAMRRYQMMVQGDRDSDRILAEDQFTSRIKARQNDTSDKRRNIFNVNPDARNATYRYPYRDRRRSW
jgi:hypothetical protein